MFRRARHREPIEEFAPVARGARPEPIHRGSKPRHAHCFAKFGCGCSAPIAAREALQAAFGRTLGARAQHRLRAIGGNARRHRPRLRAFATAIARDLHQAGAAQAPARREHRQRFDQIGFARAIRPEQAHGPRVEFKLERGVVAKIREREPRNVKPVQRHTRSGINT